MKARERERKTYANVTRTVVILVETFGNSERHGTVANLSEKNREKLP